VDPDLPLIRALQAGDDSALDELIRRHQGSLLHFVYRYLRNEAAARDVVQEAFVRTYFKAAKFEPRATVKTWVYAIALNLCRDHARRSAKRRGDVSLAVLDTGSYPNREPADPHPLPSELATRSDLFARVRRAIDLLPHKLKSALILCSLEGMTHQEAAKILGTSPKTVELRIYHAKHKLRELLADEFHGGLSAHLGTQAH
jgi:RNA polymerase sigma factor (sigma-70 family)